MYNYQKYQRDKKLASECEQVYEEYLRENEAHKSIYIF